MPRWHCSEPHVTWRPRSGEATRRPMRTDIYAIGVMLYEIIETTAVRGRGRGAAPPAPDAPVPVAAPRRTCPSLRRAGCPLYGKDMSRRFSTV